MKLFTFTKSVAFSLLFVVTATPFAALGRPAYAVSLPDDPATLDSGLAEPRSLNPDRTIEALTLKDPVTAPNDVAAVLSKYKFVDPMKMISRSLLKKALLSFDANLAAFPNQAFLGVVDFSIKSKLPRWFVINMQSGNVWAIHVAHGNKSDANHDGIPETFGNVDGSNMSSLGIYRTAETYESDKFGHSLRVDGLSKTNSNVRPRAVVIHPAWYVWESNSVAPGRTEGCLGVSKSVSQRLIAEIQNGSMIYVGLATAK